MAANLPFHARRDSDKHSQLTANIEDIILAFDALDSSDSIPPIFCEANDLFSMPTLCLDPTAEQVQQNTNVLQKLVSQVENLEKKIPALPITSQGSASFSYAQAASTPPKSSVNVTLSSSARLPSTKTSSLSDDRARNLVLFGLPENDSMEVELLEFLSRKPVSVNYVFCLGKYTASSERPRPVLIKLAAAWDRRVILLRKRCHRDFKIQRLFLREDDPPDHRLRQRGSQGWLCSYTS